MKLSLLSQPIGFPIPDLNYDTNGPQQMAKIRSVTFKVASCSSHCLGQGVVRHAPSKISSLQIIFTNNFYALGWSSLIVCMSA